MSQHKAAEPDSHFYSLSDDFSVNFFYVQNTFCYTLRTQKTQTHSVVSSHNNSTLKCVVTPISIIIIWRVVPEWRWPWQPKSSHRCKYPGSPVSSDAAGRTPNTPDAPDKTQTDDTATQFDRNQDLLPQDKQIITSSNTNIKKICNYFNNKLTFRQ